MTPESKRSLHPHRGSRHKIKLLVVFNLTNQYKFHEYPDHYSVLSRRIEALRFLWDIFYAIISRTKLPFAFDFAILCNAEIKTNLYL